MEASVTTSSNELDSFLSQSFLDLEKIAENLYRTKSLWQYPGTRGIYGGQLIGHSMIAASKSMDENQHIHSLHSYFLKNGKNDTPILYHVDKTREGRTYCSRSIKATQQGHPVYTMQASFKQQENYSPSYQVPMPDVPFHEDLLSPEEIFEQLRDKGVISQEAAQSGLQYYVSFPIMMKWVDPDAFLYTKRLPPTRYVWMKARGHIGDDMDHNTHMCCLGYMTDSFMIQTSFMDMAPVRLANWFHASLDHSMWFHGPCRADEWMLLEIKTSHTGDGRTLTHGRIWTAKGDLVVSVAQEGVMRERIPEAKL